MVQARREGSAPAMALITPHDPVSAAWTAQRPSSAVVHRLAALARRSLAAIQVKLLAPAGRTYLAVRGQGRVHGSQTYCKAAG